MQIDYSNLFVIQCRLNSVTEKRVTGLRQEFEDYRQCGLLENGFLNG
jgi:hypothetical protein